MPVPWDNSIEIVRVALEQNTRTEAKGWLGDTIARFNKEQGKSPDIAFKIIRMALVNSKAYLPKEQYLRLKYLYGYKKESEQAKLELERLEGDSYQKKTEEKLEFATLTDEQLEEVKKKLTDPTGGYGTSMTMPYINYATYPAAPYTIRLDTAATTNAVSTYSVTGVAMPYISTKTAVTNAGFNYSICKNTKGTAWNLAQIIKKLNDRSLVMGDWFYCDVSVAPVRVVNGSHDQRKMVFEIHLEDSMGMGANYRITDEQVANAK